MFVSIDCFSQSKYLRIENNLDSLRIKINHSFIKTINKESEELIKRGVNDSTYFGQLNYYIDVFSKNELISKQSIYYYNMDDIFLQFRKDSKNLEIENMYLVSFQSDDGELPIIHNFIIIDNFDLIKFYGLKTIRDNSFYFTNSFSINFEQFFLNLPYSYYNVKTTSTGGVHNLFIAKISATLDGDYNIETKIAFSLLPYQEIYLKYLLGLKKDFSFWR